MKIVNTKITEKQREHMKNHIAKLKIRIAELEEEKSTSCVLPQYKSRIRNLENHLKDGTVQCLAF